MPARKPFRNLDLQSAYDTMVTHLRQQHKPATTTGGWCVYRGKDGSKCAVGALIPDTLYTSSLEGDPIDVITARFGADEHARNFLSEAQKKLHDEPYQITGGDDSFMYYVERGARALANKYGLTYCPTKASA